MVLSINKGRGKSLRSLCRGLDKVRSTSVEVRGGRKSLYFPMVLLCKSEQTEGQSPSLNWKGGGANSHKVSRGRVSLWEKKRIRAFPDLQ